jgi:arabinose-5-phosphate isomerase
MTQAPSPSTLIPEARRAGAEVLRIEAQAIMALAEGLTDTFDRAVAAILGVTGKVVTCGMGKSGHVARKVAATFASTGTPAHFVHPAEACHGDLGMIAPGDVCVVLSASGETVELRPVLAYCRRFAIPVIGISKVPDSALMRQADIAVALPDLPEACALGLAPTTSTTVALALGDALAVAVMRARGFDAASFQRFHPGGRLGAQLMRVRDVMHAGAALPVVAPDTLMPEVLMVMTGRGFGIAAVVRDGWLTGVITDGDLRRNMAGLMDRRAADVATPRPRSIGPDALIAEAVRTMNAGTVTALCVVDPPGRLVGLVRLHDCLHAGVV